MSCCASPRIATKFHIKEGGEGGEGAIRHNAPKPDQRNSIGCENI